MFSTDTETLIANLYDTAHPQEARTTEWIDGKIKNNVDSDPKG